MRTGAEALRTGAGLVFALMLAAGCAAIRAPDQASASSRPAPPAVAMSSGAFDAPAEADLYLGLVDGLIRQERYRAALAFLDQYGASGAHPTPRFYLLRGEALLGSGDGKAALSVFGQLTQTSFAGEALDGEGRAQAALGQWAAAENDLNQAAKVLPSRADILNNLAYVKLRSGMGRARDAIADLRAARELAPHSDLVRDNLVLALTLAGEKAEADDILASIADRRMREAVADFAVQWGKPELEHENSPRPRENTQARAQADLRRSFGD